MYVYTVHNVHVYVYTQFLQAGGGSISPLVSLVKKLPDILLRQYNYETAHVTGGAQLQHSPFFQVCVWWWVGVGVWWCVHV